MNHLLLIAGLTVLVGFSLGLLGGGGSILMVPLLTYVGGLEPAEAIAASLFVVCVTSLTSAITHASRGNLRWRSGLVFGAVGMVGAYIGGLISAHIPGTILMIAFALVMLATAVAMIRGRKAPATPSAEPKRSSLPFGRLIPASLLVGSVTGLIGAGGGFLVVPVLALLGGLTMPAAIGTSLLVIAMNSLAGLASHLTTVRLDWSTLTGLTLAAVVGSLVGALLTNRVPETRLRRGFGIFVIVIAVFVLYRELIPN